MTLQAFNLLDINAQADWLWDFQPLDERRDETHTILLYSLPDFYAEVLYHWGTTASRKSGLFTISTASPPIYENKYRISCSYTGVPIIMQHHIRSELMLESQPRMYTKL